MSHRTYSWSQHSSFLYSQDQWYDRYVLEKRSTSPELEFGSYVDKKLQDDPLYLPDMPRYPVMQLALEAKLGGLPVVGFADGWDPEALILADYKTGKKPWTQARADETGQLTFYALLLYLAQNLKPESLSFRIHWLPTQQNGDYSISFTDPVTIKTFETKRTMRDLIALVREIKAVRMEMAVIKAARRLEHEANNKSM